MNYKKLGLAVITASIFTFVACDDSSSAGPEATNGGTEEQTITSSDSNAGGDNTAASSSSVEEATNPESQDVGGKTEDNPSTETNPGTGTDSPAASSSSEEPKTEAPVDNPPDVGPGQIPFDTAGFSFDTTGFGDMMKCDEEGATQNMMGAAVLVCTDGQWVYDSTATAAANKCDEEGATKTETMEMGGAFSMDMTYICKDGQWEMQMPDFGGMFGGDSTGGFPGGMGNWGDSSFTMPGGGMGGDWSQFGGGNFGGGAGQIPEQTPGLN